MTELVRIIGIGIAGGMLALMLRRYNETYAMLAALALGTFMLVSLSDMLSSVVSQVYSITGIGSLDSSYVAVVIKAVGIAYLSEFGAQLLRDSGEGAIASKCELAGKVYILYLTLPIAGDFVKLCLRITEGI